MAVRAVIFDFDGVICQTEVWKLGRTAEHLRKLGLIVETKQLYLLAGGTFEEKEDVFDRIFGSQPRYWQVKEEAMHFHTGPFPFAELVTPGLLPALTKLKEAGLALAVASNSRRERLREALDQCGVLSFFDCTESAYDLGRKKPDPYVYTHTMELLGTKPEETVVVEDSALGIRAGKAAGSAVIALRDPEGAIDQREADAVITGMEQLPDLVLAGRAAAENGAEGMKEANKIFT